MSSSGGAGGSATINREVLEAKFEELGERDRLKELLTQRLNESGWQNQVQQMCRQIIKERGIDSVTVEDLLTEVTPMARKKVPDSVKKELLFQIKNFLQYQSGISDL